MSLRWAQDLTSRAGAGQLLGCKLAVIIAASRRWWMFPVGLMLPLCGVSVYWFLIGQARPEQFSGLTLPADGGALYVGPDLRELGDEEARWVSAVQALCQATEKIQARRSTRGIARYGTAAAGLLGLLMSFWLGTTLHQQSPTPSEPNNIQIEPSRPAHGPVRLSGPGSSVPPVVRCKCLGRLQSAPDEESGELWLCPDRTAPQQPKIPHPRTNLHLMPEPSPR